MKQPLLGEIVRFALAAVLAVVMALALVWSWRDSAPQHGALPDAQRLPQQVMKVTSAPKEINAPYFHMPHGFTVTCLEADGCIIFSIQGLVEEMVKFASEACGSASPPEKPTRLRQPHT